MRLIGSSTDWIWYLRGGGLFVVDYGSWLGCCDVVSLSGKSSVAEAAYVGTVVAVVVS